MKKFLAKYQILIVIYYHKITEILIQDHLYYYLKE